MRKTKPDRVVIKYQDVLDGTPVWYGHRMPYGFHHIVAVHGDHIMLVATVSVHIDRKYALIAANTIALSLGLDSAEVDNSFYENWSWE